MYKISKETDKPDIDGMLTTVRSLMDRGLRLGDYHKIKNYYVELRESLKQDISHKYGIENPNSSPQITYFLRDMSNRVSATSKNDILNICYNADTNKWSSSAENLEKLNDLGYEFAGDLLDYRKAKKYAESLVSLESSLYPDGLLHPEVSLAKTHRLNYSKPGIMSIPNELLWKVLAPFKEGNVLYSVDIKNQEPNILINMTGAEELKPALVSEDGLYEYMFKQCFKPAVTANVLIDTFAENRVYTIPELKRIGTISPALYLPIKPSSREVYINGKRVVGMETICMGGEKGLVPELPSKVAIETEDGQIIDTDVTWEIDKKKVNRSNDYAVTGYLNNVDIHVSPVERKEFKASWLAISYGASVFGVKAICKNIDGGKVYKYVTNIKELKEYRDRISKGARAGYHSVNTVFGTPVYADDAVDGNALKRQLLDLPIQGSGADILSLLIKHFYDYIDQNSLSGKLDIYYTRHDELIIEIDKTWYEENKENVEDILRDMMEHQVDDWVPFRVDIEKIETE